LEEECLNIKGIYHIMQKRVVFGLILLVLILQNVAAVSSEERYIVEIDDKIIL